MKDFQREIDNYIKNVGKNLLCSRELKKRYLRQFEAGVCEFIESNGISSMDEVIAHFGEPEDIAKNLMSYTDVSKMRRAISWKKLIIAFLAIAMCVYLVAVVIELVDNHDDTHGYGIESIIDGSDSTGAGN